jgi:AcrR family transcriptional regulator
MPRALTEQEKCRQCDKLLEKGKEIVFTHGIKKVSVDDITKSAGMAKGSFYHHFTTKEEYLLKLIWHIHELLFSQAEQMILNQKDLQSDTRSFLINIFNMPELVFFIKNHHDINDLLDFLPNHEVQAVEQKEVNMYEKMLILAGIDTEKIKPGVVHNYLHTLYMMMGSDMIRANA